MSERGAWIVVFLVWLFGSVVFGWLVDKISRRVCGNRQRRQKKNITPLIIREKKENVK
jgi:hypothetical protein